MTPYDLDDARTFLLMIQTALTAGDSGFVAGRVLYPIQVGVDGQPTTINSPEEFERNFESIFDGPTQRAILDSDSEDVRMVSPVMGADAAGGILRFNLCCIDPDCTETQFLITQIH